MAFYKVLEKLNKDPEWFERFDKVENKFDFVIEQPKPKRRLIKEMYEALPDKFKKIKIEGQLPADEKFYRQLIKNFKTAAKPIIKEQVEVIEDEPIGGSGETRPGPDKSGGDKSGGDIAETIDDNKDQAIDLASKGIAKLTGIPVDKVINSDNVKKFTDLFGKDNPSNLKTFGYSKAQQQELFKDSQYLDPATHPEIAAQGITDRDQMLYISNYNATKNAGNSGPKYRAAYQSWLASLSPEDRDYWNSRLYYQINALTRLHGH